MIRKKKMKNKPLNMRTIKLILTGLLLGIFSLGNLKAQNSKVTNTHFALKEAKDYLGQENFEKAAEKLAYARENIDAAVQNDKTAGNAKTWNYRGDVYADMMRLPADNNGGVSKMEAAKLAVESYKKTIELDDTRRKDYATEAQKNLNNVVYVLVFNEGIQMINAEDPKGALNAFELAMQINEKDTNAVLYAAVAAERMEDNEKSFSLYKKLIDEMGISDHFAYISVANQYMLKEDYDKAIEYVQKGIKVNKGSSDKQKMKDLMKTEFNIYLVSERIDEAIANVKKNIESDPSNDALYTTLGQLYDNLSEKRDDKDYGALAIENYKKAIELNPDNTNANYNLGAFYYNKAAALYKTVGAMDLKDYKAKGAKMEAEGKELFNKAIPYFKKAYEMEPDNTSLKNSLKTIYTYLKNYEEANKYK